MMANALIIGCGNIGGVYDISTDKVYTHAKALFLLGRFKLYFFDTDSSLSTTLAQKYGGISLASIDNIDIEFEWISIAVPTHLHYLYYSQFVGKAKCILLEKPISYSLEDCNRIKQLKENFGQRTYINYIREFLPDYQKLKQRIEEIEQEEHFSEVVIKYQRGVINNGSHALSLLSFLFNKEIEINKPDYSFSEREISLNDVTLSFNFKHENRWISFIGIKEKQYPVFEIEIFSESHRIMILNSGNKIEIFKKKSSGIEGIELELLWSVNDSLNDYMKEVVKSICMEIDANPFSDNFERAFKVNNELIRLCQNLQ